MMEKYKKYKDSGVDWLGEIPEHWGIQKLKYLANVNPSNIDKKSKDNEKEILLCNYVDVYKNEYINSGLDFMKATATDEQIAKFILRKGDVIATKDSESPDDIGVPALVTEDFDNVVCGYHLTHIKPSSIFGDYLFRCFQTQYLKSYFEVSANGVTRFGLGVDKFNSILVLTPSLEEQKAIASYLDHKTAEIDQLIAQKERLIELYEEEKNAIINEAVTKGINSDVKLKHSGIDWLGDIPEHWQISKIGHYAKVSNGSTPSRTNSKYWENGNIPWLSSGKVNDVFIDQCSELITDKALKECSIGLYPEDSVVIGLVGQGKTRGTTSILKIKACINQNMAAIEPNNNLNSQFLHRFLTSAYEIIRNYGEGGNQAALNCELVRSFKILLPLLEEQKTIASHIEKECARIDAKIAKTKRIIELQKEYRTALISEAVTGKIKVPQVF